MKKKLCSIIAIITTSVLLIQTPAFAAVGDSGFDCGISTWDSDGKTAMTYKEVCFITGEPIVFEGELTSKTSSKTDTVTTKYTYSLKNVEDSSDTLSRTLTLTTKKVKEGNNQTTESTTITKPTETITIGGTTYTLKSYDFSKSAVADDKPAVDYYYGKLSTQKIYEVGTKDETNTITVETTGDIYGYQQYWGTAEAQKLNQVITSEKVEDGDTTTVGIGTANINISAGMARSLNYSESGPQIISFNGGFIISEQNESLLEYTARLTDSADYINDYSGTLRVDNSPTLKSLMSPNVYQVNGHWSEQYVKEMFSLKIFDEDIDYFRPEDYITKGEFIAAMVNAVSNGTAPQETTKKTTSRTTSKKTTVISPFTDLDVNSKNFTKISDALKMGLINGKGDGTLGVDDYLIMADTLTIFVNALGLESLAPGENPVTRFTDNDEIPQYARRAAYVAQKIGLIEGDDNGYLNPNSYITKAQTATLISRFLEYLREDIRKDYRDQVVDYVD